MNNYQQLANSLLNGITNPYQTKREIVSVNGIQDARVFNLERGESMILMDSNEDVIYIKSCDETGKCNLKVYSCTDITEERLSEGSDRDNGMKWSYDMTTEIGNKIGISWSEVSKCEWFVLMNMMYSDFYNTAKSVDHHADVSFYSSLAKDWIFDEDAPDDKLYRYYFEIVSCTD